MPVRNKKQPLVKQSQAFFIDLDKIPSPQKSTNKPQKSNNQNFANKNRSQSNSPTFERSETRIMNYSEQENLSKPERIKIDSSANANKKRNTGIRQSEKIMSSSCESNDSNKSDATQIITEKYRNGDKIHDSDVVKVRPEVLLKQSISATTEMLKMEQLNLQPQNENLNRLKSARASKIPISPRVSPRDNTESLNRNKKSSPRIIKRDEESVNNKSIKTWSSKRRSSETSLTSMISIETQMTTTETISVFSDATEYQIPNLPEGQIMTLILHSNHGDDHFIALSGIRIFSDTGNPVKIESVSLSGPKLAPNDPRSDPNNIILSHATPKSINASKSKTFSGPGISWQERSKVNCFMAPFGKKSTKNQLFIKMKNKNTKIGMIRFYNYCFSRVEKLKGVKKVTILLDKIQIFHGNLESQRTESILFTTEEKILDAIAINDVESIKYQNSNDASNKSRYKAGKNLIARGHQLISRPKSHKPRSDRSENVNASQEFVNQRNRLTSSENGMYNEYIENLDSSIETEQENNDNESSDFDDSGADSDANFCDLDDFSLKRPEFPELVKIFPEIRKTENLLNPFSVRITLLKNWQDSDEIFRYTDIIFLNSLGTQINPKSIKFSYCHQNHDYNEIILSVSDDARYPTIEFEFEKNNNNLPVIIKVENSSLTIDKSFQGIYTMNLEMQRKNESKKQKWENFGILKLRKYIGHRMIRPFQYFPLSSNYFKKLQISHNLENNANIEFDRLEIVPSAVRKFPHGFVYELQLLSSISDQFYIGLNGIEVFDKMGEKIDLSLLNIYADPESINILEVYGITTESKSTSEIPTSEDADCRTLDKLIHPDNQSHENSWLSPILANKINKLFLCFDTAVQISKIKIYNYTKDVGRGLSEYNLLVDGILIKNGIVPVDYMIYEIDLNLEQGAANVRSGTPTNSRTEPEYLNANKQQQRKQWKLCGNDSIYREVGLEEERPTTSMPRSRKSQ